MGEELEYGNFFMIRDDGEYVPFGGIEASDIILCDELDVDTYDILPKEGTIYLNSDTQIRLELNMKIRKHREFLKLLKKQSNTIGRQIRHYKRQKERARRRKLKE